MNTKILIYPPKKNLFQGGHIKIHLHSETPVQVDGEPWVQSPGDVVVLKSALKVSRLFYHFIEFKR